MPDVARIEIASDLIDKTQPSSITISDDKLLTISLYLTADILPDMRTLIEGEKYNYRDANLSIDLIHAPIKVKLIKIKKMQPAATLVIEADVDTKVPGTGGLLHLDKQSEAVENE